MLDSWLQNVYLFVVDILGKKEIVYSSIQIVIYNLQFVFELLLPRSDGWVNSKFTNFHLMSKERCVDNRMWYLNYFTLSEQNLKLKSS